MGGLGDCIRGESWGAESPDRGSGPKDTGRFWEFCFSVGLVIPVPGVPSTKGLEHSGSLCHEPQLVWQKKEPEK